MESCLRVTAASLEVDVVKRGVSGAHRKGVFFFNGISGAGHGDRSALGRCRVATVYTLISERQKKS